MILKQRIQNIMDQYDVHYNVDEILGHITRFNNNNISLFDNVDDEELLLYVENACNIIDLNDEQ